MTNGHSWSRESSVSLSAKLHSTSSTVLFTTGTIISSSSSSNASQLGKLDTANFFHQPTFIQLCTKKSKKSSNYLDRLGIFSRTSLRLSFSEKFCGSFRKSCTVSGDTGTPCRRRTFDLLLLALVWGSRSNLFSGRCSSG